MPRPNQSPLLQPSHSHMTTASEQHGSLQLDREGRYTRYVGPGGHSFSLANVNDCEQPFTRPASPLFQSRPSRDRDNGETDSSSANGADVLLEADALAALLSRPAAFIPTPGARSVLGLSSIVHELRKQLPDPEVARRALKVYRWHVSWMYDPIVRIDQVWEAFYGHDSNVASQQPDRLALLFSILALGLLFDVAPAANAAQTAEHYYQVSWAAMSYSQSRTPDSIESVQTIHLLGQYLCNHQGGRRADHFYPILGLACRSAVAMGIHRDARPWGLSDPSLQERCRLFWELFACDAFRSLAYGRPCAIADAHANALFPVHREDRTAVSEAFHTAKFCLVRLLNRIINACYGCHDIPYAAVMSFDKEVRDLCASLPSELDTRSWSIEASSSPTEMESTAAEMMDTDKLQDTVTLLQAHTTAANIHQTLLHLHRPWFLRAVRGKADHNRQRGEQDDIFKSPYIRSVVALTESSRILISIAASLFHKVPSVSVRWNFVWQHAFNAAVCQSLHILLSPDSMLCMSAWEDVSRAVTILQQVQQVQTSRIWTGKVQLLESLRDRAAKRLRSSQPGPPSETANVSERHIPESSELHLIGDTATNDQTVRDRNQRDSATVREPSYSESTPTSSSARPSGVATGSMSIQDHGEDPNPLDSIPALANLLREGMEPDVSFWENLSDVMLPASEHAGSQGADGLTNDPFDLFPQLGLSA